MNRLSAVLLTLAAVTIVVGVGLFSPRVAVLTCGVLLAAAGVANLETGGEQ